MNISTAYAAGRLTVFLSGELDQHEARAASARISALLDEYLPKDCVLDLSELSFMDSSGIAVLVKAGRQMKLAGGRLWLENPAKQVLRVIDASGIERLIPIDREKVGGLT